MLIGLVIGLLIAGGLFGAYLLGQSSNKLAQAPVVQPTAVGSVSPSPSPDKPFALQERPTAGMVNPSLTIAAINDAFAKSPLDLGFDLGAYMVKTKVSVIIFASECCGMLETKAASNQINSYLKSASGTWNCQESNVVNTKIVAKSVKYDYLKDTIFCNSSDKHAVGFHLNDEFLIDRVIMVSDYNFLIES